jgi:hypothetical protein
MGALPLNGQIVGKVDRRKITTANTTVLRRLAIETFGFDPLTALMEPTAHFLAKAREAKALSLKPNLHPDARIRAAELADEHYREVSECAAKAAPYCHPKLAIAKITGDDGGPPLRIESLTRAQLGVLLERLKQGHGLDDSGETDPADGDEEE